VSHSHNSQVLTQAFVTHFPQYWNILVSSGLLIHWLIDWCVAARQQRKVNLAYSRLQRRETDSGGLRMANEIQCIVPYVTR